MFIMFINPVLEMLKMLHEIEVMKMLHETSF